MAFGGVISARFKPCSTGTVKAACIVHTHLFTPPIKVHTLIHIYTERLRDRERESKREF